MHAQARAGARRSDGRGRRPHSTRGRLDADRDTLLQRHQRCHKVPLGGHERPADPVDQIWGGARHSDSAAVAGGRAPSPAHPKALPPCPSRSASAGSRAALRVRPREASPRAVHRARLRSAVLRDCPLDPGARRTDRGAALGRGRGRIPRRARHPPAGRRRFPVGDALCRCSPPCAGRCASLSPA